MHKICTLFAIVFVSLHLTAPNSVSDSQNSGDSAMVDANGNRLPKLVDSDITVANIATNPPQESSLLDNFGDYFLLRKSFLTADDATEPAKFSWTKSKGESAFYELDLAFGLNPKGFPLLHYGTSTQDWEFNWKIQPTFEAHTSTQEKAEQDSLSARLPVSLYLQPNFEAFVSQHKVAISLVYETDRHQETATIGGDLYYTPTIPALAIGVEKTVDKVAFRWRPFIGLEGGHILENQNNALDPTESEFLRLVLKLHADLWIGTQFVVSADYSMRDDLLGNGGVHHYYEVSPTLFLDKDHHFSVGLSFKRGKSTPDFSDVDSINAWVGVLF